jgi:hypothetical protein
VRGTFRGVVHGEFETGPSVPVIPVAAAVLAVVIVSWLATILLILAIAAAVVAVALGLAIWLLCRRNPRDDAALAEWSAQLRAAEQADALRAETAARAAAPVENHYHLHLPPGTDARGIDWAALPVRDATKFKEN